MNDIPCTYRISVKAVIEDSDGRVLLLRERDGSWELPGGGLEHGENIHDGLTREVAEETGLRVISVNDQPVAFWTIHKEVGSPTLKWFAFVAYKVEVSGVFTPDASSDEAQEARYFTRPEAKTLPLHDNTKPYFM